MKKYPLGIISCVVLGSLLGWFWYSSRRTAKEDAAEFVSLEQVSRELVAERDAIRGKLPKLMVLLDEKRRLIQESARIEISIAFGETLPAALAEQEKKIEANLDEFTPIGSELHQRIKTFDARLSEYRDRVARFPEKERNLLPHLEPFGSLSEQIRKGHSQTGTASR